jgi:hypothetical protein
MNTPPAEHHLPFAAHRTPHTAYRTLLTLIVLFFCFQNLLAQRLEVHAIKDFSTDANATKAWGVGGAIEFDQLVKKMSFKAYFDWATYKEKESITNLKYQRMTGGITACYSVKINDKATFQCGAEISYTHLKHSYIYKYTPIDSVASKPITLLQRGDFVGIGAYVGLLYKLTPRFSVMLNVVPTYLISVSAKSSENEVKAEYDKGIWLFPIRLGLTYQLFNND